MTHIWWRILIAYLMGILISAILFAEDYPCSVNFEFQGNGLNKHVELFYEASENKSSTTPNAFRDVKNRNSNSMGNFSSLSSNNLSDAPNSSLICGFEILMLVRIVMRDAYFFEYPEHSECLSRALSSPSLYNCPPDVVPCLEPNITHINWSSCNGQNKSTGVHFRIEYYLYLRRYLIHAHPHVLLFWFDKLPAGDRWFKHLLLFARDRVPATRLFFVHKTHSECSDSAESAWLDTLQQFGGTYLELGAVPQWQRRTFKRTLPSPARDASAISFRVESSDGVHVVL